MRRTVSLLVLVLFLVWILPLGVFIKPADEQKVCAGQRAICLCTHKMTQDKPAGAGKIMLTNTGALNKESFSPAGASHDFWSADLAETFRHGRMIDFLDPTVLSPLLFIKQIEHVPKA